MPLRPRRSSNSKWTARSVRRRRLGGRRCSAASSCGEPLAWRVQRSARQRLNRRAEWSTCRPRLRAVRPTQRRGRHRARIRALQRQEWLPSAVRRRRLRPMRRPPCVVSRRQCEARRRSLDRPLPTRRHHGRRGCRRRPAIERSQSGPSVQPTNSGADTARNHRRRADQCEMGVGALSPGRFAALGHGRPAHWCTPLRDLERRGGRANAS